MNRKFQYSAACLVLALGLGSCGGGKPEVVAAPVNPTAVTDAMVGEWKGVEGTFLRVEGGGGKYQVTIQNLDGPKTFEGRKLGDRIQFERDGKKELLRTSDGAGTDMKHLDGKKDCVSIVNGEGYCRD
jgi:hypothetical protein